MVPAAESGMAFVPFIGPGLAEVPCGHHERNERTVGRDNCVSFEGKRGTGSPLAHPCKADGSIGCRHSAPSAPLTTSPVRRRWRFRGRPAAQSATGTT